LQVNSLASDLGKFGHVPGIAGYYIWSFACVLQGQFTDFLSRRWHGRKPGSGYLVSERAISLLNMNFFALPDLFAGNLNPYHRVAALVQKQEFFRRSNLL
jgi:hypothetical protein